MASILCSSYCRFIVTLLVFIWPLFIFVLQRFNAEPTLSLVQQTVAPCYHRTNANSSSRPHWTWGWTWPISSTSPHQPKIEHPPFWFPAPVWWQACRFDLLFVICEDYRTVRVKYVIHIYTTHVFRSFETKCWRKFSQIRVCSSFLCDDPHFLQSSGKVVDLDLW